MEADENTACDGEPCLPELTSVSLNTSGAPRYYGLPQVVTLTTPLPYKRINSATITADSCVTFQLSHDGQQYLTWDVDSNTWQATTNLSSGVPNSVVEDNIRVFSEQFGPGNLYLRAYLTSDTNSPCSLESFSIETIEFKL